MKRFAAHVRIPISGKKMKDLPSKPEMTGLYRSFLAAGCDVVFFTPTSD